MTLRFWFRGRHHTVGLWPAFRFHRQEHEYWTRYMLGPIYVLRGYTKAEYAEQDRIRDEMFPDDECGLTEPRP